MVAPKKKKTVYSFNVKSLKGLDKVLSHMSIDSSFCDILYKEYGLNSNKRKGGKIIEVDIYTNAQRNKLHNALKKYGMSNSELFKLFDKEHITDFKNENENSRYMRSRKINEEKTEISIDAVEKLGVDTQSIAKVLGTLYHDMYEEGDAGVFDIDEFYDYVKDNWDDVVDRYDKSNEQEADDNDEDPEYELDAPLSDGSVGLKELGIVDAFTLGQMITMLSTESDLNKLLKEEDEETSNDEWEDRTRLDGNDALVSFANLIDALEETTEDVDDDSDTDPDEEHTEDSNEELDDASEDYIDEAIREGYQFAKIEDVLNEAREEGYRRALHESKKEVTIGKTTREVEVSKTDVKALKDADKIKEVLKSNLSAIKSLVLAAKLDAKVPSMKDATVENLQALKEVVCECETCKAKADICKAIEVAKACVTALEKIANKAKKDNSSVTAKFAKYRRMFESDDSSTENGDETKEPETDNGVSDETKDPDADKNDKDKDEDEQIELSGIRVFVEKSEDGDDDYADKFKQALIDFGVAEEDITEEESDDENQTVFVVDGNSCDKLIEFGNEHGFDFEEALDAEVDNGDKEKDSEDKDADNKDKDDKDDTDDKSEDDEKTSDKEIDDMWDSIFGPDDDNKEE